MSVRNHQYLVMWCNEGLETLINITQREQENVMSVLKGEQIKHTNPIHYMILRAKFNTQRHYEIYVFNSEIDEMSIRQFFEDSPQTIVDAIRRVGHKIYSDRETKPAVIT